MNLQSFRQGMIRLAGLAFVLGSVFGLAQAQVATHTQLSSVQNDHGVTFTAQVSDIGGNPATDGVVTLENAKGQSLGSGFVKNGQATIDVGQKPSGRVYADYSGSADFRASVGQAEVTGYTSSTEPDFTITANPTSMSVSSGQFGTTVLTITPLNGFNEMVTLSCSGNPAGSDCFFSPTTLTPLNGAAAASSLQITTQASSGASVVWPGQNSGIAYAVVLPGILALFGLGTIRRRSGWNSLRVLGLVALLAAGSLGLSACAQRYDYLHHPPAGNPGVPAGTYNVTIAAYSNNGAAVTSHTINVTLTVK